MLAECRRCLGLYHFDTVHTYQGVAEFISCYNCGDVIFKSFQSTREVRQSKSRSDNMIHFREYTW